MADTTATTLTTNRSSIGIVAEVKGHATVTHTDGTKADMTKGMQVFKGDQIETDEQGAVNITFEDNTVFAVSNNAQMTIDEFVYDADKDGQGDAEVSVMRGIFVYTSGFVGKEDPSDVHIKTPAGSIGIRGTTLTGYIPPEGSGEEARISLIEGAIIVRPTGGGEFSLNTPRETIQIDTTTGQGTNIGQMNTADMLDTFNVIRSVAPALFEPIANPAGTTTPEGQTNSQGENNVMNAEDTAATENVTENADENAGTDAKADAATTTDDVAKADTPTDAANNMTAEMMLDDSNPRALGDRGSRAAGDGLLSSQVGALLGVEPGHIGGQMGGESNLPVLQLGALLQPYKNAGLSGSEFIQFINTNHAPVNKNTSFTAYEQAGLEGENTLFDIRRFFSDPDGNPLSYKITNVNDPSNSLTSYNIIGNKLSFTVDSTLVSDPTVTISVAAYDGKAYSGATQFTFNLYQSLSPGSFAPTNSNDTRATFTESNKHFSLLAGNDTMNDISNTGNVVFGGFGDDEIIITGNNNKAYGDSGDDTLKINDTLNTGNLISGGAGDDQLYILSSGVGNQLFGSDGNDTFHFNTIALGTLDANGTLVDGGAGFDTLILEEVGFINLSNINASQLHDIDSIRLANGSSFSLDITDITDHTDKNELFIELSGGATASVTVVNTSGLASLVQGSDMIQSGTTYRTYSNGNQTLYIDSDISATNVTGIGTA